MKDSDYRYAVDFDTQSLPRETHDVVIIGSGIAGVYTALMMDPATDIVILTKEQIDISSSALAQGGIAVSLDEEDSPALHFKDTISAGAGLCDEESVWVLVNEAAQNIDILCTYGVNFDRGRKEGKLSLTREAAHSINRIIHAGDTTGKEVCDKLISVVNTKPNVKIRERTLVLDLLTEDTDGNRECRGVTALDLHTGEVKVYAAPVVICATGGYGQLYSYTTNPEVATGDGIAMAGRAGAILTDLEFVQFHPTVLYHPRNRSFLISEAVRGEGAVLRNKNGGQFMEKYHPSKELAPRDVVSRAIFDEMKLTGSRHVYLDIAFKGREYLENRFPNIFRTCMSYGIDIAIDWIPVAPAEHYSMGGIRTDIFGRTNIHGFYSCGESACTGIHGANRLASNSLLEGLVFGRKIGLEVNAVLKEASWREKLAGFQVQSRSDRRESRLDVEGMKDTIQETMSIFVGIKRSAEGLATALGRIERLCARAEAVCAPEEGVCELKNMLALSRMTILSAIRRTESRGAHYRVDFPAVDDRQWRQHILWQDGEMREGQ
jgi:L-aspartate oxidase